MVATVRQVKLGRRQFPPDRFVTVRGVPVFVSHEAKLVDGRRVFFDYRLLAAICRNCNRRIDQTGDYAAVVIGHTRGPWDNPPVVGFAGPFYLGFVADKPAILADFHLFREYADVLNRYPRRSPEFVLKRDLSEVHFDPIALLGGEPPRLDMGLTLLYSVHHGGQLIERYAAMPGPSNVYVPGTISKRERLSMTDDEIRQIIEALEQLDWVQWVKRKMQEESAGEEVEEPTESPEAEAQAPAEQFAEDLPSEKIDPEKAKEILEHGEVHGKPLTEDQRKMFGAAASRQQDASRAFRQKYSRLISEVELLKKQLEEERASRINAERYSQLVALRQVYAFDLQKEFERCRYPRMSDAAFEDHLNVIRENYRKIPVGEKLPPLGAAITVDEPREKYSADIRKRARELVIAERERGREITFEEALEKVSKGIK